MTALILLACIAVGVAIGIPLGRIVERALQRKDKSSALLYIVKR